MNQSVRRVVSSAMFLVLCFSMACSGQNRGSAGRGAAPAHDGWPRFRGPSGMGVSDATGLPLEWDQTKNLAWKTACPAPAPPVRLFSATVCT